MSGWHGRAHFPPPFLEETWRCRLEAGFYSTSILAAPLISLSPLPSTTQKAHLLFLLPMLSYLCVCERKEGLALLYLFSPIPSQNDVEMDYSSPHLPHNTLLKTSLSSPC